MPKLMAWLLILSGSFLADFTNPLSAVGLVACFLGIGMLTGRMLPPSIGETQT